VPQGRTRGPVQAGRGGAKLVIISHIPIISVCAAVGGKKPGEAVTIPESRLMTDATRLHDLFLKHGGVKLCLSGHIHLRDRVEYDGITYLCDGAVSGSWWKGRSARCREGYGVVDLFEDGTWGHEYVEYGWKAVKEEKKG
jgi:hypothetical protein